MFPNAALLASGSPQVWEDSGVEALVEAPNSAVLAILVTSDPALLSIISVEPSVSVGGVTVACAPASVSLSAIEPAVSVGAVTVAAATANLIFTGVEPTVTPGGVSVASTPAAMVFSGIEPSITIGPGTVFVQGEHATLGFEAVEGVVIVGEPEPFLYVRLNPRALRRTGLRAVPRYGSPERQMGLPRGVVG